MPRLMVHISWLVEGPFVTAGAQATPSVDKQFHRDAGGALCVSKSHVKGKLREGLDYEARTEFPISDTQARLGGFLNKSRDGGNIGT